LPPLSPAFRTRRLLGMTLRDLRRLAMDRVSWTEGYWESRIFGRLAVLPDAAEPLQRSQLVSALAVGTEIIQLRSIASSLGLGSDLGVALDALARGNGAIASARLALLDERLATFPGDGAQVPLALRGRGSILAISEALEQHAS